MRAGIFFEATKTFSAPQEKVFNSFLSKDILVKIWRVNSIRIDARPGGKADAKFNMNGENWNFTLTYKEVIPYEKLSWVVHFERFPDTEVHAELDFKPAGNGTEIKVRLDNFLSPAERTVNKAAWENALKILDGIIS